MKYPVALSSLIGAAVLCLSGGCRERAASPRVRLHVAIDVSGSMSEAERRQCLGPMMILVDELARRGDLTLYQYARQAQKLFAGTPDGSDALMRVYGQLLEASIDGSSGTSQAAVLEAIVRDLLAGDDVGPIFVVLLTDGEDLDLAATRRAAESLAELPVRQVLVGPALTECRDAMERALEPLGTRAIVVGEADMHCGLEIVIDDLRHPSTESEVTK